MTMASGWANDGAVQQQIDATVDDAVQRVRRKLASGPGSTHCQECGELIPEARRRAIVGVKLCVKCQRSNDAKDSATMLYNRRASKNSQLR